MLPLYTSLTGIPSTRYATSLLLPPRKWPSTIPACKLIIWDNPSTGIIWISSDETIADVEVKSLIIIGFSACTTTSPSLTASETIWILRSVDKSIFTETFSTKTLLYPTALAITVYVPGGILFI